MIPSRADLARRLRDQSGQTAAEYLGLLLLVAVVVFAFLQSSFGERIALEARAQICKIAGERCDAPELGEPSLADCKTEQMDRAVSGSVKVLAFRLEGGLEGVMEINADDSVAVTLKANGGAGIEISSPGVEAEGGGQQASSPRGEFAVTGRGEYGRTWKFGSREEADEFLDSMVDKVKAQADLMPNFLQGADDYEPPEHEKDTLYGGVAVEGSGSAGSTAGGAYAEGSAGVEAGLGMTWSPNGERTYFFKAKAQAAGSAGVSFAGGFGASGDGEVVIGIRYDRDGNEKEMIVQGVGTVSGGVDAIGGAQDLETFMKGLQEATVSGSSEAGRRIEFDAKLDLTVPENRDAARAFLDGRDPRTGEFVPLAASTAALYDRFDADGQLNARTYEINRDEAGVDVDGSVIGFSGRYKQTDAALRDAWFDPGPGGFRRWHTCAAAAPGAAS